VTWRFRQPIGADGGLLFGVLALLAAVLDSRAQATQPSEYQLKAAFLYHFAQLVTWPAEAFGESGSPMVIAVLGENPFGKQLEESVRGKSVNGHPLTVKEAQTLGEVTNNCHVLFVSSSEKKRLAEILAAVRGKSVLTVGETDHFTETGGMINFTMEGTKIRFQINDSAAKAAGLKISSKLLSLATSKPP
jgi:hypothetical protein